MAPEFNPPTDAIGVTEILEPVTLIEFTVPIGAVERPEVELFNAIAAYLRDQPSRIPVVGVAVHYISDPIPMIVACLFTAPPTDWGPNPPNS